MSSPSPRLLILTGDHSADMHAAAIARALRQLDPSWLISGVGGVSMRDAGVELLADHTHMNVIGPGGVLRAIPSHRRLRRKIVEWVQQHRPRVVMLVDYGMFHLWLGPQLRALGAHVIYFIPPQIWASRPWRIRKLRRAADEVLCILPFEPEYYQSRGIRAQFVGNPLVSQLPPPVTKTDMARRHGLDSARTWIGLFPGSRRLEIRQLLWRQLQAARILNQQFPGRFEFALAQARNLSETYFQEMFGRASTQAGTGLPPIKVLTGENHALLSACDLALVASGTVTLEAALYNTPMVIMYRGAYPAYLLARMLMTVSSIGMPNLLAGRRIVPELWQNQATGEHIADEAVKLLDETRYQQARSDLQRVSASVSSENAANRVAEIIAASTD